MEKCYTMVLHKLVMCSVIVGERPLVIMEGNTWVSMGGGGHCGFVFSFTVERYYTLESSR